MYYYFYSYYYYYYYYGLRLRGWRQRERYEEVHGVTGHGRCSFIAKIGHQGKYFHLGTFELCRALNQIRV